MLYSKVQKSMAHKERVVPLKILARLGNCQTLKGFVTRKYIYKSYLTKLTPPMKRYTCVHKLRAQNCCRHSQPTADTLKKASFLWLH